VTKREARDGGPNAAAGSLEGHPARMPAQPTARLAFAACGAGVLLHLYTAVFKAEGGASVFLLGLLLFSCAPYAIAALVAKMSRGPWLGLGAAAACLVADAFMHYSVFIAPKGSTAALGLLFMPVWNLVAVGPAGAILSWLMHRFVAGGRVTR